MLSPIGGQAATAVAKTWMCAALGSTRGRVDEVDTSLVEDRGILT
jgi:hypothetical protein